jgi:hypothetical protein
MRRDEIERVHETVVRSIRKKNMGLLRGVKIPVLYSVDRDKKRYTVGGLMLVFFASRVGMVATKEELLQFLRQHRCTSNDPQPRHMGMQMGLNFLVNGCFHPKLKRELRRGEYCLLDLRKAHPAREMMHRSKALEFSFDRLKQMYDLRCACCGSRENEKHFKNALLVTKLERGHCDPSKPLSMSNCIPMCNMCNMVYKNNAVLNARGFVVQWNGVRREQQEEQPVVKDEVSDAFVDEVSVAEVDNEVAVDVVDEVAVDLRPSHGFLGKLLVLCSLLVAWCIAFVCDVLFFELDMPIMLRSSRTASSCRRRRRVGRLHRKNVA